MGIIMMRFIKAFLFGITGLFIIITLLSLLITSNVRVVRTTVINNTTIVKPYQQTVDLKNWKNWHPIFKTGVATISFGNISFGKNAACDIKYNNKITHLLITDTDSSFVKFVLQSPGENDIENIIGITPLTSSNEVRIEWRALTKLHWYPWEKFYAIFLDKITGPGYDAALTGLKDFIEKNP
jgi:hypothetical protein